MKKQLVDLSIVIVSYNTAKLTIEAIASIEKNYPQEVSRGAFEIIVSDNSSHDGSVDELRKYKKTTKIKTFELIENKENLGFSKANNVGIKHANGRYILFLNSDTVTPEKTLTELIDFMDNHPQAGAATCRVTIPTGGIDDASHRGFPTPWNAFCHFSGLAKIFSKTRLFGGYNLTYLDFQTIHEVDAVAGAFLFVRREAGEQIGWWDEDYFFYGEDVDFCYMLKEKGWKIYYVPTVSILHYKGVSGGIKKHSEHLSSADKERKIRVQNARFDAMRIFYRKHYMQMYPAWLTSLVFLGIDFLHKKNLPK